MRAERPPAVTRLPGQVLIDVGWAGGYAADLDPVVRGSPPVHARHDCSGGAQGARRLSAVLQPPPRPEGHASAHLQINVRVSRSAMMAPVRWFLYHWGLRAGGDQQGITIACACMGLITRHASVQHVGRRAGARPRELTSRR